jgi:radical SAM protein with 4Fe4S-binding SPASM domain
MSKVTDAVSKWPTETGPSTAWVALTEACNNRCSWCYESENEYLRDGRTGAVAKHLTLRELQVALPTLKACGLVRAILIGGEPTLVPNCLDIVRYVKSLALDFNIVTNGRRAARKQFAFELASAGISSATVSLHGWSASSYEGHGDEASFLQTLAGFHNLQEAGIAVGATMVLGANSIGHEPEIVGFLRSQGISQIQFNTAAPAVSRNGVKASFTAPLREMARHAYDIFVLAARHGIFASFQLNLPFCLFDHEQLDSLKTLGALKQSCHVPYGKGIVLRPGLRTAVCTHLMDYTVDDPAHASPYSDPDKFIAFWRSSELQRERAYASAFRKPECAACIDWDECGGGCMVHWSYYDPISFNASETRVPVSVPIAIHH